MFTDSLLDYFRSAICPDYGEQLGTSKAICVMDGWMDWIGSQTICTARAPLSGANNNNGDDKDYNSGDDYYNPTRS